MNISQEIIKELLLAIPLFDKYLSCPNVLLTNAELYKQINLLFDQVAALKRLRFFLHKKLYQLDEDAYVKFDLAPFKKMHCNIRTIATLFCFAAGDPFLLYDTKPYWEPLSVKLKALPNRTHGVGANPFHVDLLTRSQPPEVIAFLGVRIDPLGGGYTELSDLSLAVKQLSSLHYELLSEKIFQYWQDQNVQQVGEHLVCYSIIPEDLDEGFIRYTAKMLAHLDVENSKYVIAKTGLKHHVAIKQALQTLQVLLAKNALRVLVQPDELLLFNQRRFAHCRTCLGEKQFDLPLYKRRLLLQAYLHKPNLSL